jgi:two-component system, chemotaxis family, sensor kinase CheA
VSVSDAFLAEAAEQADSFASLMGELRPDEEAPEVVRELFRFAHNLKGMSAMEGITELNRLAHASEDLLDRYRTRGQRPTSDEIDLLLAAADAMSSLVDQLGRGTPLDAHADLVATLDARAAGGAAATDEVGEAGAAGAGAIDLGDPEAPLPRAVPPATLVIHVVIADDAALAGARATVLLRHLGAAGEVAFTIPDRDAITAGQARAFLVGVDVGSDPTVEVDPDRLEPLLARLRAVPDVAQVVVRARPPATDPTADAPEGATAAHPPEDGPARAGGSTASAATTVRVEASRLDALLDVAGELVIERNRLDALVGPAGDPDLKRALADLRRTVGDLERLVQRVRMVPIAPVFTRLQRLVRETARDLGTPVTLTIEGEHTEVDRSVADEILQPMVHLLRNAIDHGIEPAEVRTERGKPERGALLVKAEQQGDHVVFEVSDDGGGLDEERIASKALASGLLDRRQVASLDRAAILDLIFAPGFSTNDDVSLVSGRGVGLDVVRAAVNRFGGGIEVTSEAATGTTFRIRLPLSLVVVNALVVRVATELWALPLQRLVETVMLRAGSIREAPGPTGRVVAHRSGLLPVIDGGRTLARGAAVDAPCPAVVIETVGRPYVLTVDELLGHAEMVVRPVPIDTGLRHLGGVATLADGRLALVLDVAAFVDAATFRDRTAADDDPTSAGTGAGSTAPTVPAEAAVAAEAADSWVEEGSSKDRETTADDVDLGPDADDRPDRTALRATERQLFDAGIRRTQPVLDHYIRAASTVSETTSRDVGEVAAAVIAHPDVIPVAFTLGGDIQAVLMFAIVAETQLLETMGAHPDQHAAAVDELGNMLGSQFVAALADEHGLSVTLSTPVRPERTVDDLVYLLRGAAPRAEAPPVWHAAMLGGPEPIQVLLAVDEEPAGSGGDR